MRRFSSIAFIGAIALVGCSSKAPASLESALKSDDASISYLETLHKRTPKSALADTATWNAISTQDNSLFVISYESLSPESKGQIAHNLKIAFAAYPDIGLQAETAKIWGMDTNAITNLRENKPTKIAERIDLTNVSYFGFKEWMEDFTTQANDLSIEKFSEILDENNEIKDLEAQLNTQIDIEKYDFNYGRITIDGLHWSGLAPAISAKADEDESTTKIWDAISGYARWSRAFNIDALLTKDTKGEFIMRQNVAGADDMTQDIDMKFDIPFVGLLGYNQGDTAFITYKDIDMQMTQDMKSDENGMDISMDQGGTTGLLTVRDFKVSNLFSHLANRELPPTSATNLLSLGKWHGEDMHSRMSGDTISVSESFDIDLTHFHWLIPTKMSFNAPDTTYDISSFLNIFSDMISSMAPQDMDAKEFDDMNTFFEGIDGVLGEHDLENLSFAGNFSYDWNPETGKFDLNLDYNFKELLGFDIEFNGFIGDFTSFETAYKTDENLRGDTFTKLLSEKVGLDHAHYSITDHGVGLDKIFGLVIDIAKLVPEDKAGQMAMLQNTDAPNLRLMASSMVRMGGMAGKEQFPQAVTWSNLAADFLQKGGEFKFAIDPDTTLNQKSVDEAKANGVEKPEDIINFIGVAVTHTAPAE
ncbi:hypothetical protein [Hirschia litorea]|uniref:Lipoprotein n=1 Tax=Hirschia litorea TaxID=1199156 RepID=A0ABW2INI0_9PROT